MGSRPITHAEAVYIARALNLNIEAVWEIIRHESFSSYSDLELTIHRHMAKSREVEIDTDCGVPTA